jgi:hypothetical protein
MGLNTSVQQFLERQRMNDLHRYLFYFPEENTKQLDQDEIIETFNQAKAPEWHEVMMNANIDIFEMSYVETDSYFKSLDNTKRVSATNSVGKSSENHKGSNMWCHYCDKNNHNMTDCRAIAKFKQQKNNKAHLEAKA